MLSNEPEFIPDATGVVKRSRRSLMCEHLQRREVDAAGDLAVEVENFLVSFTETRPHESLGHRPWLDVHLTEPHLFRR